MSPVSPSHRLDAPRRFVLTMGLCASLVLAAAGLPPDIVVAQDDAARTERGLKLFRDDVRAILVHNCLKCHGGEVSESEFSLVNRDLLMKGGRAGAAIEPGSAKTSRLYQRISHSAQPGMPYQAEKLKAADIERIAEWIDLGAPYDQPLAEGSADAPSWIDRQISPDARTFWSFQPLKNPAVPGTRDADWSRTPVDRFILARLEAAGLAPNPGADRIRLLRRATFELTGLPPTPEQAEAFLADTRPEAWEHLIDQLLDSPHYGERWARHWLDVARFAESHGYEHDYDRPTAYTYRDFVIQAFNQDLPFDQFVKWQIAGDEFAPDDNLAQMATGFLAAGVHSTQITKNEVEKHRYDELDDIVGTIGLSMLGLSVGCARCHDHKYDPIPQRDYYRLVSTFTSTVRSEVELQVDREEYEQSRRDHAAAHAPLIDALKKFESEHLGGRLADWEARNELRPEKYPWIIVEPRESKSEGGATLSVQPDGSVTATGANPQFDTYQFTVHTRVTGIRGLRIEALAMPGLVRNGPGRADNGNFDLTDLKVTIAPQDKPDAVQPLKLMAPRATFEQPGLPIAAAIDDNDRSGWAVDPEFGKDHAAAFTLSEPAGFEQGSILTVRLTFKGNDRHNFGRTRLAITAAVDPPELTAAGLPGGILAALATAPGERSADQTRLLLAWYGSTYDPEWQRLNRAVLDHASAAPRPKLLKSLISSEGLPALRLHTQGDDFLEKTHFLRRGDPDQKVAVADQGFLQVLMPEGTDLARWQDPRPEGWRTSYRRRTLANWLTDAEHGAGSLLARVIVNRLWQHHFGTGLVSTPSDFGVRGAPASHSELLEWLAAELVRGGWKLKPIHKLILQSAAWQQSARYDEAKAQVDRDNRLLWRKSPRRLEAEVIRDSVLAISGLLDPTQFGPGTLDESSRRRSIYFTVKRSRLMPMLQTFDAPDALSSVGERSTTTVAPQALLLLNNPQTRAAARSLASRVQSKAGSDPHSQVTQAYQFAVSRGPVDEELADGVAFITQQTESYRQAGTPNPDVMALADYCQVVMCLNEFVYLD